jgi:hypothetical protein
MADNPAPLHPIEVRISIGANGPAELRQLLRNVVEQFEDNDTPNGCSGGWDGGWSITTAKRDVSADDYRTELETWRHRS